MDSTANEIFANLKEYYDCIEYPKYRNVDLAVFKQKYEALVRVKKHLETNMKYIRLVSLSTVIIHSRSGMGFFSIQSDSSLTQFLVYFSSPVYQYALPSSVRYSCL